MRPNLFALKDFGNIYSRIMNPINDALEQKMAALEGGVAALAVSSGQAASAMAIQNLCRPGDNVVSSTDLYGGTWNLFANTLPSMGHHRALRRSGRSGGIPPGDR
jgi:O-acetylhomoserine (thiol)-lyase